MKSLAFIFKMKQLRTREIAALTRSSCGRLHRALRPNFETAKIQSLFIIAFSFRLMPSLRDALQLIILQPRRLPAGSH